MTSIQLYLENNLWGRSDRAYVVAHLVNQDDIRQGLHQALTRSEAQISLMEFPGVLLPAFMPTLKAMQRMSGTLDVPLADILAPLATPANPDRDLDIGLPAYATKPGFEFDLSTITRSGGDFYSHLVRIRMTRQTNLRITRL